jgi:hypothetical protein
MLCGRTTAQSEAGLSLTQGNSAHSKQNSTPRPAAQSKVEHLPSITGHQGAAKSLSLRDPFVTAYSYVATNGGSK